MAFGAELKDFVAGFKTGYDLISSPEEKASKRAAEARAQGSYDRQGQWHDEGLAQDKEDREYRRSRDEKMDTRYDENQSQQRYERGQEYELRLREFNQKTRDKEMERMDREQREMGGRGVPDVAAPENPYGSEGGAVPGGSERNSGAIPDNGDEVSATPAAYLSGDPTARLTGPEAAATLASDLQNDMGLPRHVAIGITGALAAETGGFQQMQEVNPTVPGSRGGYGFAQWTGPRRRAFEHYAGDRTDEYGANYGFLKKELTTGPESAVLDRLKGARTAQEAQRMFTDYFLRPGTPNYEGRARWTNTIDRGLGGGGMAVKAARGGLIDPDPAALGMALPDGEEAPPPMSVPTPQERPQEVAGAIPDDVPTPMPRPDYDGADSEPDADSDDGKPWKKGTDPYEAGREAVREGLKRAMAEAGGAGEETAIQDPQAQKVHEAYIRGYGAAPRQMMKQVIDKIDPDRKMAPGERNMLAMGTVYKYYMDNGDVEQAQQAAASMVQYYRQQSQQFLALGQAAAAKGDYDNAAKAAIGAYANIPNGRDFMVEKNKDGTFNISVTDTKTGKVVNRKVMSPSDFGAAAMQFNPGTFDDEILNAAGAKAPDFKEQSTEALANVEGGTRTEVESAASEAGESNPERVNAISDIATSIAATQENGMGPGQAARFAQKLASVNKDDPTSDTPGFSAKPVRGNPDRVSVTMDGQTVVMSKNALAALTGTVGQLKEEAKKAKADDEASAQWKSDVAGKISKSVDMFKQGAAERTETMRNPPPDNAGDAGTAIGGMLKPPGQTDKAIPDTAGEAVQPTVDLDERGMPAETSANQQVIDNLLNYRRSLMKVQDDPRAARMLQQINGRLRQLGYED